MKKVSVITPCYNAQQWIDRCVESLVTQTIGVDSLELILVDDASTDQTLEHLKKWEKKYPDSILVIACEKNGRQGTARNIGLMYASAPYIGYVDADDWVEKDMYQELYQVAVETDADVVSGLMGQDVGDGAFIDILPYTGPVREKILIRTDDERRQFLRFGLPGHVGSKIYKKSLLVEKELFFPELLVYEDNYFASMLSYEVSSVYVVNRMMYHYFVNESSTVQLRNSSLVFDRMEIEQMILEGLAERGYFKRFRKEICKTFISRYYTNTLHMFFTKLDVLPVEKCNEMRKVVLETFPDWQDVYDRFLEIEKMFLETLEVDEVTSEMWENLKANYLYLIRLEEELENQEKC